MWQKHHVLHLPRQLETTKYKIVQALRQNASDTTSVHKSSLLQSDSPDLFWPASPCPSALCGLLFAHLQDIHTETPTEDLYSWAFSDTYLWQICLQGEVFFCPRLLFIIISLYYYHLITQRPSLFFAIVFWAAMILRQEIMKFRVQS